MEWPETPVTHRSAFRPPHCAWDDCSEHRRTTPGYRFRRHGSYDTQRLRGVPRYRCKTCWRTFSRQAFSVDYYAKRPGLYRHVAAGLVAGSALRQIARSVDCAPNTAARIAARLGRHAMLLQAYSLEHLRGELTEPVNLDHFEAFEFTQDYPVGVATPVGTRSWFVYGLDPAPHRRAGRRSAFQKKRSRPKRALRGSYLDSTRRVLDLLCSLGDRRCELRIVSDAHPDYRSAVRSHPERKRIRLERYANPRRGPKGAPRSAAARVRDSKMFANDLLHKILRHSQAHHRRETIAFARRLNALMERLYVFIAWRNFIKKLSERKPDPATPAMRVGLTDRRWSWKRLLSRRLFFHRIRLPEPLPTLYRRAWITPILPRNQRHILTRAF
jgi:transposase-like protein